MLVCRTGLFAAVGQSVVGVGLGGLVVRVVAGLLHGGAQGGGRCFCGAVGYGEDLAGHIKHCALYAFYLGHAFFNAGFANLAHSRGFKLNSGAGRSPCGNWLGRCDGSGLPWAPGEKLRQANSESGKRNFMRSLNEMLVGSVCSKIMTESIGWFVPPEVWAGWIRSSIAGQFFAPT